MIVTTIQLLYMALAISIMNRYGLNNKTVSECLLKETKVMQQWSFISKGEPFLSLAGQRAPVTKRQWAYAW